MEAAAPTAGNYLSWYFCLVYIFDLRAQIQSFYVAGISQPKVGRNDVFELTRRRSFLTARYAVDKVDGTEIGSRHLREAATYRNLCVGRSATRRITFYPRGLDKKGHTVATFSRNQNDPGHWAVTGNVDELLARWNKFAPIPDIPNADLRRQSVVWNGKSRSVLVQLKATTDLTQKAIAERLNQPGLGCRHEDSRPFTRDDVKRELRRHSKKTSKQPEPAAISSSAPPCPGRGQCKKKNLNTNLDHEDTHLNEDASLPDDMQASQNIAEIMCLTEANTVSEAHHRRNFLATRHLADAGPLRSQTLRGAAMKRNLSIGRSTQRRLTFYPRGIDKKGHSIATFSRNKRDPDHWVVTGNVDELLARWNRFVPVPNTPNAHQHKQSVVWTQKSRSLLTHLRISTDLSKQAMAAHLNQPGAGFRPEDNSPFSKDDVERELRRLFPQDLDVHQIIWTLRELKNQPGWETLSYIPEQIETATGTTLRSLVVILPKAKRLAKLFGDIIHVDCTSDSLSCGHKV